MVLLAELENTLWGIVLEGTNRYEHKSERPIHISMAALDTNVACDEFVPVVVETSSTNKYVICTLSKQHVLQQPIELELNSGESVTFCLGAKKGAVHLTGYYLIDSNPNEEEEDGDEEECCDHEHGELHTDALQQHDDDDDDDDDDEDAEELTDDDDEDDGEEDDDDEEDDEDDGDDDEDDDDDDDEDEEDTESNKRKQLNSKNEAQQQPSKKLKENGVKDGKVPKLVPNDKADDKSKEEKEQADKRNQLQPKTLAGGTTIVDKSVGHGPEAKNGKVLSVYYAGRLKENGKQFDALSSGKPFTFRLGRGDVIKGWDVGMQGMKVGGKRTITVPPSMGYGNKRSGPIPPNSTLVFDVELKAVN